MNAQKDNLGKTINPAMVTLGREGRGLTQTELSNRLEVSQGQLSKIEAGLCPVSDVLLAKLSKVLDYPEQFFYQTGPIYGPSTSEFFHRKRQSVSLKLLGQVHAQINMRRMHVATLLRAVDLEKNHIHYFDLDEFDGKPGEIARAVRASWQLPNGPIKNVIKTIEDAGGIVIRCAFSTPRIDAISRWVPGMPPLFFVNQDLSSDRERLTLCHELGHILMHQVPTANMEEEANRFAAEFLMPERDISSHLDRVSLPRLANLKPFWKVSMAALLYRAADLGKVTERMARHLWMQMGTYGYRRREPPELDIPREEPGLLQEIVDLHLGKLGYNLSQLSKMLLMFEHEVVEQYNINKVPAKSRSRLRIVK